MPLTTRATIRTQCFKDKVNWKHFCEPGWAHIGFSKHTDTVLTDLVRFFLSSFLSSFPLSFFLSLLSPFSARGRKVAGLRVDRVTYENTESNKAFGSPPV